MKIQIKINGMILGSWALGLNDEAVRRWQPLMPTRQLSEAERREVSNGAALEHDVRCGIEAPTTRLHINMYTKYISAAYGIMCACHCFTICAEAGIMWLKRLLLHARWTKYLSPAKDNRPGNSSVPQRPIIQHLNSNKSCIKRCQANSSCFLILHAAILRQQPPLHRLAFSLLSYLHTPLLQSSMLLVIASSLSGP